MSVAELKSELAKLAPSELAEIDAMVQRLKEGTPSPRLISEFFGSARGTITFLPGWDEDEPLESWEALKDDVSL